MYSRKLSTVLATVLISGAVSLTGCGGGGSSGTSTPPVETNSVNTPPVITSAATTSVNENQNIAIDVDATDPDSSDTLTYSIEGGPDAASVVIDSTTGKVVFITTPDFETKNVYHFTVGVSDGSGVVTQDVTVNINDVAEGSAPIITSGSEVYADENQRNAFTITASDVDGDVITYSVEGGTDAASFDINASTGVVTFKTEPDFETKNLYAVTVGASDATDTTTQNVTVHINDLDGTSNVLQTGQTIKYADGDDGDIRAGKAHSFTDTGTTVKDNAVGLEWKDNSYIAHKKYSDAVTYCANVSWSGHTDWRLPTIDELYTITDRGAHDPAIFNTFDNTNSAMYWAINDDYADNSKAYVLNFSDGTDFTVDKNIQKYARCVRKDTPAASSVTRDLTLPSIIIPMPIFPLIRYGRTGLIVTDYFTKLQWFDNIMYVFGHVVYPLQKTWDDAVEYCYNLSYDGKNDWRLPNINELLSITEKSATTAVKASTVFESLTADTYWTSTTSDKDSDNAWIVNFATGQDAVNGDDYMKTKLHNVRCVRTMGD